MNFCTLQESKTAFEEALKIDPESPGPLLGLARTALAAKDFEAAIRYSRESIGLLFFQPRAHYIHGLAQYRLGHWEEAEHACLICVWQAPLFSEPYSSPLQPTTHQARDFRFPSQLLYFALFTDEKNGRGGEI